MPLHVQPDGASEPIGRRAFLAGLAACGSGLSASGAALASAQDPSPGGWYALLSDVHIAANPASQLRGQTMAANLRAALADVLASGPPPLGLFIDGDLALRDGQPGDYATLMTLLDPVRQAGIPIHLTLGNHDARGSAQTGLKQVVPAEALVAEKLVGTVEGPGLRFVLLDTLDIVNEVFGTLGAAQLEWLGRDLDAHRETPTLVFLHHNPSITVPQEKQAMALLDTPALLEVVRPRKQVKALVFGHTHTWEVKRRLELSMINLPAIAYTFSPNQPLGWLRFRPLADGADLELRCIGGSRRSHGQKLRLTWRAG